MDELSFWRSCCERGISICAVPKPFREDRKSWLVDKHPTFIDRKIWDSAYTFDLLDEAIGQVKAYLSSGREPDPLPITVEAPARSDDQA